MHSVGMAKHRASIHVASVLMRVLWDMPVCGVQFRPPHYFRLLGAALVSLMRDTRVSADALQARRRDRTFRGVSAIRACGVLVPLAQRPEFFEWTTMPTSIIIQRHSSLRE